MADKDVTLTTVAGGAPLARTIGYPKLTHLKRDEQKSSWARQLKSVEEQVQGFYMMAVAYPEIEAHQENYRTNVEALDNLRAAYDEWLKIPR